MSTTLPTRPARGRHRAPLTDVYVWSRAVLLAVLVTAAALAGSLLTAPAAHASTGPTSVEDARARYGYDDTTPTCPGGAVWFDGACEDLDVRHPINVGPDPSWGATAFGAVAIVALAIL